jgi:hypothetical protein
MTRSPNPSRTEASEGANTTPGISGQKELRKFFQTTGKSPPSVAGDSNPVTPSKSATNKPSGGENAGTKSTGSLFGSTPVASSESMFSRPSGKELTNTNPVGGFAKYATSQAQLIGGESADARPMFGGFGSTPSGAFGGSPFGTENASTKPKSGLFGSTSGAAVGGSLFGATAINRSNPSFGSSGLKPTNDSNPGFSSGRSSPAPARKPKMADSLK